MDDPQAAPIGSGVYGFVHHLDAPKGVPLERTRKLVVVSGHKHDATAFSGLPEQLLHDVVMQLRPKPATAQLPTIHDISHQVQRITSVVAQKLKQCCRLTAGRSQVQV